MIGIAIEDLIINLNGDSDTDVESESEEVTSCSNTEDELSRIEDSRSTSYPVSTISENIFLHL